MSLTEDQIKMIELKKKQAMKIKASKVVPHREKIAPTTPYSDVFNSSVFYGESTGGMSTKVLKQSKYSTDQVFTSHVNKQNVTTGSCYMISSDRFSVSVTYNKVLIDAFKSVKSCRYDAIRKEWNFHINEYNTFMDAMKPLASVALFIGLPKIILETFRDSKGSRDVGDEELSCIDPKLMCHLMPFQLDAVRFGVSKNGRCLIADDMGLGKTIEALAVADFYRSDWPLLIVCPSSVRFDWLSSIDAWLQSVKSHHVHVMTSGKDYVESSTRVVIISYDLLARHGKKLATRMSFGVVIMDESHYMKNFKSERTRVGTEILAKAKRVLLLSGTPALSRPNELYTQIAAIEPKAFKTFHEFAVRYCDAQKRVFGWDYSGSSNMEELQLLLERRFMIRRLKSEVLAQLPDKRREVVVLDSNRVRAATTEMEDCLQAFSAKGLRGIEKRGALLSYYNATGIAKLPAVRDYITGLLERRRKFICFAHHQSVLDAICRTIDEHKCKYVRIDGSTASEERKRRCDLFQFDEAVVAAVLSITAAYTGITLTAAQLVVFAELFWNPGILTQAEDRVHRLGQKDSVEIRYLVAKGTADDHLWALIQNKLDVLNKAGLSKDNFHNSHVSRESQEVCGKKQKTLMDFFEELGNEEVVSAYNVASVCKEAARSCEEAGSVCDMGGDEGLWEDDNFLADLDLAGIEEAEIKKMKLCNENS